MSRLGISNSKLFALQSCGEFFRRRYMDNEGRPGTLRMHRGGAVHESAREAHRRQFEAKKLDPEAPLPELLRDVLPSVEEAKSVAADAFDAAVSEGVTIHPDDIAVGGSEKQAIGDAKDATVCMAGFYTDQVAPGINPVAFERKIIVRPKDADFEIRGILDLVEQPVGTDLEVVPDLKTTERTPPKDSAHKSGQLTLYALLRQAETGTLPEKEVLRALVRSKKDGSVKLVEHETKVTEGDIQAMVNRVNVAVQSIQAGIFVPAEPGHWKCSAKWCEYFADCRFALRRT